MKTSATFLTLTLSLLLPPPAQAACDNTTKQIADLGFISYSGSLGKDADASTPIDGTVNMEKYAQWLKTNYGFTVQYGN